CRAGPRIHSGAFLLLEGTRVCRFRFVRKGESSCRTPCQGRNPTLYRHPPRRLLQTPFRQNRCANLIRNACRMRPRTRIPMRIRSRPCRQRRDLNAACGMENCIRNGSTWLTGIASLALPRRNHVLEKRISRQSMQKRKADLTDRAEALNSELSRLLAEIETEPVPERLLKLAMQLQSALARRKQDLSAD